MGTQGAGRKRSTKKDRSTAEDDALNLIAREAEARLAAKRAARAEAREIRMKELERQQKELSDEDERMSVGSRGSVRVEDRDYLEKGSRAASALTAGTLTSLGGTSSRRGSGETAITVDAESALREIKDALAQVEEKYRKAMVSNAQLDNEKNNLMYQVDTLKDSLMELEELLAESRREFDEKVKDYEREKHAHGVLQFQFNDMKETLKQSEELLNDIRQLRMKQDGFVREISDLQETVEWKDKKIGALERQKEYTDAIRIERDELREEAVKLKDILKKHGIVLGPDLNINGDVAEAQADGSPAADAASLPAPEIQTSSTEGNSMLGNAELRSSREDEVDAERRQEHLKENHSNSDGLREATRASKQETSDRKNLSEPQEDDVRVEKVSRDADLELVEAENKDEIQIQENVPGTESLEESRSGKEPKSDMKATSSDLPENQNDEQENLKEREGRHPQRSESAPGLSNAETEQENVVKEEAEEPQNHSAKGKKKKKKKRGKKKVASQNDGKNQEDDRSQKKNRVADVEEEQRADRSTPVSQVDASVREDVKESDPGKIEQEKQEDEVEPLESPESFFLKESRTKCVWNENEKELNPERETLNVGSSERVEKELLTGSPPDPESLNESPEDVQHLGGVESASTEQTEPRVGKQDKPGSDPGSDPGKKDQEEDLDSGKRTKMERKTCLEMETIPDVIKSNDPDSRYDQNMDNTPGIDHSDKDDVSTRIVFDEVEGEVESTEEKNRPELGDIGMEPVSPSRCDSAETVGSSSCFCDLDPSATPIPSDEPLVNLSDQAPEQEISNDGEPRSGNAERLSNPSEESSNERRNDSELQPDGSREMRDAEEESRDSLGPDTSCSRGEKAERQSSTSETQQVETVVAESVAQEEQCEGTDLRNELKAEKDEIVRRDDLESPQERLELVKAKSENVDLSQQTLMESDEEDDDDEGQSFDFDDVEVEAAFASDPHKTPAEQIEEGIEVTSDQNEQSSEFCQSDSQPDENAEDDWADGKADESKPMDSAAAPPEERESSTLGEATGSDPREEGSLNVIKRTVASLVEEALDVVTIDWQSEVPASPGRPDGMEGGREPEHSGREAKKGGKKSKGKSKEDCKMS